jgi:transcriptional regulator with XRE-family HTH domain
MKSINQQILPRLERILVELGGNIRLARLRRGLGTAQVSERAGISRSTLWSVERGSPLVAIGNYLMVLFVLGLEKDLLLLAKDDVFGRKIQDAGLQRRQRAPKSKGRASDSKET